MKRRIILWVALLLIASFTLSPIAIPGTVVAQSKSTDVNADLALCLPGVFESLPGTCMQAGPSQRLNELAAVGITFPQEPLPVTHPPYDLYKIPFSYALLDNAEIPVYSSLEDALNGNRSGSLASSRLKYISYIDRKVTDSGTFYENSKGQWMNGEYVSRVSVPYLQGYLIKSQFSGSFAWVKQEGQSRTAPGYVGSNPLKSYFRMDVVRVYETRLVGDAEWDMIGPDEWIEHRFIGKVTPNPTPPEGVTNGRWIEVNLYEQTLTVYDNAKLIFATLISSGSDPFYTQPGLFQVYKKLDHDEMYGSFTADRSDYYYLEDVPYIMYYDEARALHGSYWNTMLGYPASHGCVNLSAADAHWLFNWANQGEWVYVWDPSGKTPTDPAYYGPGGA